MSYIPNAFQVPNEFVDAAMAGLSGNAVKCYLTIVRQTTGWHKIVDYIAISQFMEKCGIKKRDTVGYALAELEEFGLIERIEQLGRVTGYKLKIGENVAENQGETHPDKRGTPKMATPPDERGYPTPTNGVGTHPDKRGTTKPNIKPTNTKPINTYSEDSEQSQKDETVKPKKQTAAEKRRASEIEMLTSLDVDKQVASDWIAIRKDKNAGPLTKTALDGFIREATAAGLSLSNVITLCVERGWKTFRADYLLNKQFGSTQNTGKQNTINQIPAHTNGGAFSAKDVL